MGKTKCCCGEAGCCSGACSQVIDRVEVDITETGSSTLSFSFNDVGLSIVEAGCYLAFIAGQNAVVTAHRGAIPCVNALDTIYEFSLEITQTGALAIDELTFPCASPNAMSSKVVVTVDGLTRTYYWSTDIYLQGTVEYKGISFGLPNYISIFASPTGSCDDDAAVAASIKAAMVSALSSFPEMASSNFSVSLTRTPMASTGASLAVGLQVLTKAYACTNPAAKSRTLTVTKVKHGFVLELTPGGMKGTLLGSSTTECDFTSSPPPDVSYIERADSGFVRSLGTTLECWVSGFTYSHTINLPIFSVSPSGDDCSAYDENCGVPFDPPTITTTLPDAKTITIDVRVYYV